MKLVIGTAAVIFGIAGTDVQAQSENIKASTAAITDAATTSAAQMRNVQVKINGMSCMACVASVKKRLSQIDGVKDVKVTLVPGSATVKASPTVTTSSVVAAINELGFKAIPKAPAK